MLTATLARVRALFYLNCLLFAGLGLSNLVEPTWWLVGACYFLFGCVGIIVTLHRYHAHGSFAWRWPVLSYVGSVLGMLAGTGSALGWVAVHRAHHADADGSTDPHSPANLTVAELLLLRYPYPESGTDSVRVLLKSRFLIATHLYYFGLLGAYTAVLLATGGLDLLYSAFIAPAALLGFASGLTNFVNHWGSGLGDRSRNVWWMNAFNFGDGWHRNHHERPHAWTTQRRWWQLDPAGWVIRLVKV